MFKKIIILMIVLSLSTTMCRKSACDITGIWDAGSAGGNRRIILNFGKNGDFIFRITESDIRSAIGKYTLKDKQLEVMFKNSKAKLVYNIINCNENSISVSSQQFSRLTWSRKK
jgi:hypothetical protein